MEIEIRQALRALTADEIFDLVREDLQSVERAIAFESAASADTVNPISKYLQQKGGDHLRAAVLLLCARFAGGGDSDGLAIKFGAVVELLHVATLVHGGVFDAEGARHGRLSHVEWANGTCVLAGDWLYLRAFRAALQERVFHLVIGAAQMMVAAELIQVNQIGSIDITEVHCIEQVDRKTACLFSVCGRLGAVAAGADECVGERLAELAWNLGMAFQLSENILDFASSEWRPGKPPGRDLSDGKVTLPLVYALEQASVSERNLVAHVLQDRSCDPVPFANVLALVGRYGGIERTRARARQFTDRARQLVAEFPDSLSRRALLMLTHLVTEREC